MEKYLRAVTLILSAIILHCLSSCIFFCKFYQPIHPLSYDDNTGKNETDMKIVDLRTSGGSITMQILFHSDYPYIIRNKQFALFNGEKKVTPKFAYAWAYDTLQSEFINNNSGMEKNSRKRLFIRNGYNKIALSANHLGKALSKPLRLTFVDENSSVLSEIFSLKPENVVLIERVLLEEAVFVKKSLIRDSVRMMLIGECAPHDFSSLVRESMDEKEKQDLLLPRRFLMLTFDRLKGYDVDPFKAAIHAGDTACHVKYDASYKSYTFEDRKNLFRTRELVDNRLPHLLIEITYKDDKLAKSIPPLYLLPGEFISKDGIPVHTDTIEIYGGAKG